MSLLFWCDNRTADSALEFQQVGDGREHRVHGVEAGRKKRFLLVPGAQYEVRVPGEAIFRLAPLWWVQGLLVSDLSVPDAAGVRFACRLVPADAAAFGLAWLRHAAAVSAAAPLQTLRLRAQLQRPAPAMEPGTLWAGNAWAVLRFGPGQFFRSSLKAVLERIPGSGWLTSLIRRAVTGAASLLYSYPLESIHTLLAVGVPWTLNSGTHGLYSGLAVGVAAVAMQHICSKALTVLARATLSERTCHHPGVTIGIALVSGAVIYPLDTIRRTKMLRATGGALRQNAWKIGRELFEAKSLYAGFQWNLLRAAVFFGTSGLIDSVILNPLVTVHHVKD